MTARVAVTADSSELSGAPSPPRARHRRDSSACATRSSAPTSSSVRSTAPTRPTAATTASTSSTRTCRASPRAAHAIVVDGNNADDRGDYRPGRQAAREFGVRSPLDEVDLTKDEIRELSRQAGLPTWDEPASACLSSRIPYHAEVTDEKLRTIERAGAGGSRARLPRVSRPPSRRSGAASRSRATRCRARSSRRSARRSSVS